MGNIARDVIAVVAFLLLFTGANHKNSVADSVNSNTSDATEYGSLVSGFVSDQIDRFGEVASD